jgi:4a-hydroxytetrahydrobiopterin dehydratase
MWIAENDQLFKAFEFKNFAEALQFVNIVGALAEAKNHHPNILMRDYKFVDITLTTHDEGYKITEKDVELSQLIDSIDID